MVNIERPQDNEIVERCRVLEKRLKSIEGRDTVEPNAINMCLVPSLVILLNLKYPTLRSTKGIVVRDTIW